MKKLMICASALLMSIVTIAGGSKTYTVDTKTSNVNWVGEKVTGKHTGTLKLKEGAVDFENGKPVAATIKVDMNSMTCTDLTGEYAGKLIGHLKSDDFFSVEANPVVEFIAKSFESKGGDKYMVKGDLTIKGITNEISFEANISEKGDNLMSDAHVVFDRTKWNIKYGSGSFFDDLGDKTISDEIKMDFTLSAK
jgi:polyisoprenoid-binding protein YceI